MRSAWWLVGWLVGWLVAGVLHPAVAASRPRRSSQLRDMSSHLEDRRLPHDVKPVGYDVHLLPHLEGGVFSGDVWANVTCHRRTSTVVLHAHEDLAVSLVSFAVNPQASSILPREIEVRHMERELDKQWLVIMLSERLEKDNSYRIHLKFNGSMDGESVEGLYRRKFLDDTYNRTRWYADTTMKLDSARRIFPCFDEPEFKAVFEVKIATPSRQHVFSNMPLADITDMSGRHGWYWKHFTRSPPMSTMSFGMFMFEFEHYSLSKGVLRVTGRSANRSDLEKALENLDQVYEFFLEYLGVDNPLPKLDLVAVPEDYRKEMTGSFGLIAILEESLDSIEEVTYLTVGQWVRHLMTPQWWGELDVSAGLILHLGHTFLEKRNYIQVWDRYSAYYEYAKLEPYKGLWSQRDYGNFVRASWFIRMIQYAMTEETFMTGLKKFLQVRQYETFSEHDLWTALTRHAWSEDTLPRDVLVEDMAKTWLTKERFPVVTITRNYGRNTATAEQHVFLRKKFYRVPDMEQTLWYIPLMYLTADNMNVSTVRPAAWMKNQRQITLSDLPRSNQFIVVNPAEIGMFLVNYDPTNWALLADALHRRVLPVAVRAKLLHDAWNLAFAGELNFNSAMNMTLYLKDETEYAVWDVIHTMFDHVGRYLDGTRAGDKFKRYFVQLATRALEKVGGARWSRSGDDNDLYGLLRNYFKLDSSRKPTQRQRSLFDTWARGNGDSSAKTVEAMCLTFNHGTMEEFERGLQRVTEVLRWRKDSRSPSLLRLIANCVKKTEKIEMLLRVAFLGQDTGFTDQDRRIVASQLSGYYNGYSTMFSFLRGNWDALRHALEDKPDLWVDLVMDAMTLFKTEQGLKTSARMFAEKREELGNAAPAVQAGIEEMTANVQWSRENVPVLEHWLDLHLPPTEDVKPDYS